jgi:hypothetical protein
MVSSALKKSLFGTQGTPPPQKKKEMYMNPRHGHGVFKSDLITQEEEEKRRERKTLLAAACNLLISPQLLH